MAYDLEEQEQLAELKAWWKDHGTHVLLAVAAAAVAIAGYQGWRHYRYTQSVTAAALYAQLDEADRARDRNKVRDLAGQLAGQYSSTPYGALGAMTAARASFESRDLADAKARLAWVLEHASEDAVKDVARLRLAAVLLDEKSYPEALKTLDSKPSDAMAGLYADLRGDILVAQGNRAEARNAYQLALDKSEGGSPYRATVQLKLDALGEPK